jgi:hypothetical protein
MSQCFLRVSRTLIPNPSFLDSTLPWVIHFILCTLNRRLLAQISAELASLRECVQLLHEQGIDEIELGDLSSPLDSGIDSPLSDSGSVDETRGDGVDSQGAISTHAARVALLASFEQRLLAVVEPQLRTAFGAIGASPSISSSSSVSSAAEEMLARLPLLLDVFLKQQSYSNSLASASTSSSASSSSSSLSGADRVLSLFLDTRRSVLLGELVRTFIRKQVARARRRSQNANSNDLDQDSEDAVSDLLDDAMDEASEPASSKWWHQFTLNSVSAAAAATSASPSSESAAWIVLTDSPSSLPSLVSSHKPAAATNAKSSSAADAFESIAGSSIHWPVGTLAWLQSIFAHLPTSSSSSTPSAPEYLHLQYVASSLPSWLPDFFSALWEAIESQSRWFMDEVSIHFAHRPQHSHAGDASHQQNASASSAMTLQRVLIAMTESLLSALQPLLRRWLQYMFVFGSTSSSSSTSLIEKCSQVMSICAQFARQIVEHISDDSELASLFSQSSSSSSSFGAMLLHSLLLPFASISLQHASLCLPLLQHHLKQHITQPFAQIQSSIVASASSSSAFKPSLLPTDQWLGVIQSSVPTWSSLLQQHLTASMNVSGGAVLMVLFSSAALIFGSVYCFSCDLILLLNITTCFSGSHYV